MTAVEPQAAATMDGVVRQLADLGGLQVRDSGATQGAVTVRVPAETLEAATSTLAGTPGLRLADMFAANDSPATTLRLVWAHDCGYYLITETEFGLEGGEYPPLSRHRAGRVHRGMRDLRAVRHPPRGGPADEPGHAAAPRRTGASPG